MAYPVAIFEDPVRRERYVQADDGRMLARCAAPTDYDPFFAIRAELDALGLTEDSADPYVE